MVRATKTVQADSESSTKIRLWVLSGEVLLDYPHPYPYVKKGAMLGDYMPVHPEHYKNRDYLMRNAEEIDW